MANVRDTWGRGRARRWAVPTLVAALALGGCSGDDDTADEQPPATDTSDVADEPTDDTAATSDGDAAAADTTPAAAVPAPTAGPDEVHELAMLDNGVQIAIGTAWVDADLVGVPIVAWNGTTDEVAFGDRPPELSDNASGSTWDYEFQPPTANTELRVPSGEVLRGTLVFSHTGDELPDDPGRFNLELRQLGDGSPAHLFRDLPFTPVG
jgi:hypothetical protein